MPESNRGISVVGLEILGLVRMTKPKMGSSTSSRSAMYSRERGLEGIFGFLGLEAEVEVEEEGEARILAACRCITSLQHRTISAMMSRKFCLSSRMWKIEDVSSVSRVGGGTSLNA